LAALAIGCHMFFSAPDRALAQVVNSTWSGGAVGGPNGSGNWSTANNWSPNQVPNNGGGTTYNVTLQTVTSGLNRIVTQDIAAGATIGNLAIQQILAPADPAGSNTLVLVGGLTATVGVQLTGSNAGRSTLDLGGQTLITPTITLDHNSTLTQADGISATSGTIMGNLVTQGLVELNGLSTIQGSVTNFGGGVFGYTGSQMLNISGAVLNTDLNTLMTINGPTTILQNVTNQSDAVMVMHGQSTLGLVDRPGGAPDLVVSLFNQSGANYTFRPTGGGNLVVTGLISNTGTDGLGNATTMNLLGPTTVIGRGLSTNLLTNTNGAVLNYGNGVINVGLDRGLNVPFGNLNNTGGTVNGLTAGNLVLRGGDQVNNGTINLSSNAQLTVGPTGTNTLTNNGTLDSAIIPANGVVVNSPILNGNLINNGLAGAAAATTLNLNSVFPVENNVTGTIAISGTLSAPSGLLNQGTVSLTGGSLSAGVLVLNEPGGVINSNGGLINTPIFINPAGGTVNLTLPGPASLLTINSTTLTQAGVVNIGLGNTLAATGTSLLNSGTINLGTGEVAAPGLSILNAGAVNVSGVGALGTANGFVGLTSQVSNTGVINVLAGGSLTLGGAGVPLNSGTMNVGALGNLSVVGGAAGAVFTNQGYINLASAAFNDAGLGRGLLNAGNITGNGAVNFAAGIVNGGTGNVTASGGVLVLNGANVGGVSNLGTFNIQDGSTVAIPNVPFVNAGKINMLSAGTGTLLTDGLPPGTGSQSFTNAATGVILATGQGNVIDFGTAGAGVTTITNNGTIQVGALGGPASQLVLNASSGNNVVNNGTILAQNTGTGAGQGLSTFGTLTNNSTGTITIGAGSNFTTNGNDFTNAGGVLTVTGASTGTVGVVANNVVGGAAGQMNVSGGSTLNTAAVTTDGGINVSGGSMLNTRSVTNTGSIAVSGASTMNSAAVMNSNTGSIAVTNLSTLDTLAVTNTGAITLSVGSNFTTNKSDFTNFGGLLDISAGTATVGDLTNTTSGTLNGRINVVGVSTLTTGDLGNDGAITVFGGSTLTTETVTNTGSITVNNSMFSTLPTLSDIRNLGGTIDLQNTSILTAGNLINTGGLVNIGGGSSAFVDALNNSNANSQITISSGSSLFTAADVTNAGVIAVTGGSALDVQNITNTGSITLNSSTLTTNNNNITNNGGVIALANGSTATINDLANAIVGGSTGAITISGGSTLTVNIVTNGGTITVTDAGSAMNTTRVTNTGSLIVDSGATFTTDPARFLANNGGMFEISGGSRANIGQLINAVVGGVTGEVGVTGMSTLMTRLVSNDGAITVTDASTLSTGAVTNTGTITVAGTGTTFTTGLNAFTNTGGLLDVSGGATVNLGAVTSDASGRISVAGSSTLTTGVLMNAGSITVENLSNMRTGMVTNSGEMSVTVGSSLTTNGAAFINNGGLLNLAAGTATLGALTNTTAGTVTGQINVNGVSVLTTGAVTNNGAINVVNSTFTNGGAAFMNNGGQLEISSSSTVTLGALTNALTNGVTGQVGVTGTSMLTTGAVTNSGTFAVADLSTFTTNGAAFMNNGGLLQVTDVATATVGTLTNGFNGVIAGQISVAGGSSLSTQGVTSSGSINLNFSTLTTNNNDFMNNGGSLGIANMSTATVRNLTNAIAGGESGQVSVTGSSSLATLSITNAGTIAVADMSGVSAPIGVTNTGAITIAHESTLTTQFLGMALVNNGGLFDVSDHSTVTTGEVDNGILGGVAGRFSVSGVSTLSAGALNNSGQFSVSVGSTASMLGSVTNAVGGTIAVSGSSTLNTLNVENAGALTVADASTFSTQGRDFINSGGLLQVTAESTATVANLMNNVAGLISGNVTVSGASKLNAQTVTNAGVITVTDPGSVLTTGAVINTGVIVVDPGASFTSAGNPFMNNGGALSVLGAGTTATVGDLTNSTAGGSSGLVTVAGGASLTTGAVINSGVITVTDAGSMLSTNGNDFTNNGGATLSIGSAASALVNNLINSGDVNLQSGAMLNVAATLTNNMGALVTVDGVGSKLTAAAIMNNGILLVTNGGNLDPPTLMGSGKLELLNGSSASVGSYTMSSGGALAVDGTSLLRIAGDWSNQLKDATQFQVNGTVELNGAGPLQHVEVAGHDFGNTLSANTVAFANNFNIGSASNPMGTLKIDSGAHVMLVDQFDNGNRGGVGSQIAPGLWTGSPTGSEALYVWNLVIGPDVTIDFNNLHLYYEVGASGGVGPNPAVWLADLAIWQAQGDVFIGGEPYLIPLAYVPEPSSVLLLGTALACLSACAWHRRRRIAG